MTVLAPCSQFLVVLGLPVFCDSCLTQSPSPFDPFDTCVCFSTAPQIHLDLEQLRQEIDMRDNIIAKIVTFQDDLGLGNIKMEFKLGYFAIDTQV